MFTLLAGLLLALYAAPSHAEVRSGDDINFDLRLPKGFCALLAHTKDALMTTLKATRQP